MTQHSPVVGGPPWPAEVREAQPGSVPRAPGGGQEVPGAGAGPARTEGEGARRWKSPCSHWNARLKSSDLPGRERILVRNRQ